MDTSQVQRRSKDAAGYLRDEVQRAPYSTLGMVAAAGYILGGGLTPTLVRLVALNVSRAMAGKLFAAAVRSAFDQGRTS